MARKRMPWACWLKDTGLLPVATLCIQLSPGMDINVRDNFLHNAICNAGSDERVTIAYRRALTSLKKESSSRL